MIEICMCDTNYKLLLFMSFDPFMDTRIISQSIIAFGSSSTGAGQAQLIISLEINECRGRPRENCSNDASCTILFLYGFLLLQSRLRIQRKNCWDKQHQLVTNFHRLVILNEWHLHHRLVNIDDILAHINS